MKLQLYVVQQFWELTADRATSVLVCSAF